MGASWPRSYCSWIYNYLCNRCLSPLMLWVRLPLRARSTTLCDKVYRWLATSWWFSPDTLVSSTNKTDRHDITEILLKVELNTIKPTNQSRFWFSIQSVSFFFLSLSFDHSVFPSSIYVLWLAIRYLQTFLNLFKWYLTINKGIKKELHLPDLQPTIIIGVFGMYLFNSGTHLSFIFSSELMLSTEKQTSTVSVPG